MDSPFWHYNSTFDAVDLIRRHAAGAQVPRPGYLLNYFGVAIDPKFFPTILSGLGGTVEVETVPANWHSDIAEFAAALRAVELARDRFTVVELGCGWGCWINLTGVVARRAGLKPHLIGIEGDPSHLAFAAESTSANGFALNQVQLHHGIATARPGIALFPVQQPGEEHWGLQPVFDASEADRNAAVESGQFQELRMISLDEAADGHGRIDLLHMDIQGGEADLVEQAVDYLNGHVAYLVIGTHSRQIEGRLFDILLGAGWILEIERPAIYYMATVPPPVYVDGVQGWMNPRLQVTPTAPPPAASSDLN